jgi:hypothetical protein
MQEFRQIAKLETLREQPHKRAYDEGGYKLSNFIQTTTGNHANSMDRMLLMDVNDIADISIRDQKVLIR